MAAVLLPRVFLSVCLSGTPHLQVLFLIHIWHRQSESLSHACHVNTPSALSFCLWMFFLVVVLVGAASAVIP